MEILLSSFNGTSPFEKTNFRLLIVSISFLFLMSCGGSPGDSNDSSPPPPVGLDVNAGIDQTIILSDIPTLTAIVTENGQPPQNMVTYNWSQISGPGGNIANIIDPTSESTAVIFPAIGTYKFSIQVDTDTDTALDTIDITVNQIASGASGLINRPSNITECVAPAAPPTVSSIRLENPYPNLPALNSPLAMYMAPGDSAYWYVVQQTGQVIKFANNATVNAVSTYINISNKITTGGELGLLGMAFHPNFTNNGYVYLSYTGYEGGPVSRISRFNLDGTGQVLDPNSEVVILQVTQPAGNHNGGQITFGPDGYLYIGLGDGGGGGDTYGNGQNTNTLLGAILRIDVGDGSSGNYSIPATNPFAISGGQPEIFAFGLRNPWRWSFDRSTGDLWAGDVGQGEYEEIDIITNGANYGWPIMEGTHCYADFTESCDKTGLTLPVAEYNHTEGVSVTGGYVYRGSVISFLQGHYLYGDFGSGKIWALEQTGPGQYTSTELLDTTLNIASFAEDHDGELYVINLYGGISKIVPDTAGQPGGVIPTQLSGWGCFDAGDTTLFSSSVIPYNINTVLWSDTANKDRFIAVPNGATIDIDSEGRFDLPVGSIVGKNFRLNGTLIETRLLLHHEAPHGWKGYSYEWNAGETDATLLTGALDKDFGAITWHYPSQAQCDACHTSVAGFTLGPEIGQLNRTLLYPGPNSTGIEANQLITLENTAEGIGILNRALTDAEKSTSFYAIDDTRYSSERRARSYLHSNCANCHQPGGPGGGNMDLRFATSLSGTRTCNESALGSTLGLSNPLLIAPGAPDSSILVLRMEHTGQYRMPPLGTDAVDTQAMTVIRDWITNMTSCD